MTKLFISFTLAPVKRKPLLNFLHHHHQLNWFNQPDPDHKIITSTKTVVNRMVDSLLEEIGDQLESLGLDPLPIPDIRIPYSLDTVIVLVMLLLESWLVVVCQYMNRWIYRVVCLNPQTSTQVTDHVLPALEAQATGWESLLESFSWSWWCRTMILSIKLSSRHGEVLVAIIATDMRCLLQTSRRGTCSHSGWEFNKRLPALDDLCPSK